MRFSPFSKTTGLKLHPVIFIPSSKLFKHARSILSPRSARPQTPLTPPHSQSFVHASKCNVLIKQKKRKKRMQKAGKEQVAQKTNFIS
jgi:hypothetical protein